MWLHNRELRLGEPLELIASGEFEPCPLGNLNGREKRPDLGQNEWGVMKVRMFTEVALETVGMRRKRRRNQLGCLKDKIGKGLVTHWAPLNLCRCLTLEGAVSEQGAIDRAQRSGSKFRERGHESQVGSKGHPLSFLYFSLFVCKCVWYGSQGGGGDVKPRMMTLVT